MRTVLDEIQTAVDHFGYVTLRQADVDRVHALLLKGCQRCQALSDEVEQLQSQLARARRVCEELAGRCAGQSEVLARQAERNCFDLKVSGERLSELDEDCE